MANFVYIATSIDGYIAREDGALDWLTNVPNPDGSDFGFADFLNKVDAIIMGRNTFEVVLTFEDWVYTKPVFVLSHSLKSIPLNLAGKVEILSGDPNQVIQTLKSRGFNNFYIDGGNTIHRFLENDLIDEMIITTVPILLSSGIPLFSRLNNELTFNLITSEILNGIFVKNSYKRDR